MKKDEIKMKINIVIAMISFAYAGMLCANSNDELQKAAEEAALAALGNEEKVVEVAKKVVVEEPKKDVKSEVKTNVVKKVEVAEKKAEDKKLVENKEDANKKKAAKKDKKSVKKQKKPPRDMHITSKNAAFDRKENVMLFNEDVFLDDENYKMHADRVFVFTASSNDVKRVVAIGKVAITNELKSAQCDKAVYDRTIQRVIMYGTPEHPAVLKDSSKKGGTVIGKKITFWLDSQQVEIESSDVILPGGAINEKGAKNILGR